MVTSILHRATGIAMYAGTVLLVAWLVAAVMGQDALNCVNAVYGSWFGQLVLFGFTWAMFQHLMSGLRHFIWDFAVMMEIGPRVALSWATLAGSTILTLLVWTFFVWAA
jgi:succinate dehydrogenase / fumarate reductase cytochrome b subunit